MANTTQPARSCVLRVGIKCCKGCQTNAKRKLLGVSGVTAVEYNAEQGLLTVSGDPNPAKLLQKLAKWDKNAELVSLPGEVSAPAPPITPQLNQTKRMEKRPTKCFLLRCFRNPRTKEKVEPYRAAGDENGSPTPFINTVTPPMVYPPPQAVSGFATPIPYPPPCFGASQPPSYTYTSGMFQSPPPRSPPTFQLRKTQFPQMVNYPHH
ncbi:Heavy metal transport/detoxification superfamily protein [Raphanus sativus]|nr:Heavy metal transport/detoxification superfamily protein [Raphanus sativus]